MMQTIPKNVKLYYECVGAGPYWFRVYHYDDSSNHEVMVKTSDKSYGTKAQAGDAACEWLEENNLDAEMS